MKRKSAIRKEMLDALSETVKRSEKLAANLEIVAEILEDTDGIHSDEE